MCTYESGRRGGDRSKGLIVELFDTKQKAVTSRWPTGIRAGNEFKMPTMG
jgi:hypothetical protein